MSKSIYEEALEVNLYTIDPDNDNGDYEKIYKALEQAKKQEKLLGLYKELITVKNKMIHSVFFDNDYNDISKIEADIIKQIKELENDK